MKASQEQIQEWKSKYGSIFELEFDGKFVYIFDPISKLVIMKALMQALSKGSFEYIDTLLANCWIGGDEAIKTDNEAKMGLIDQAKELIDLPEADVDFEAEPGKAKITVEGKEIVVRLADRQAIKYSEDRNKAGKMLDSQIYLLEKIADPEQLKEWKQDVKKYIGLLLAMDKVKARKYVSLKKL